MVQSTHKGFAYRLGRGLGTAVWRLRVAERRLLDWAARIGRPARFLAKLLLLGLKLAGAVAVFYALLPVFSWLISAAIGFLFLLGMVYLVANPDSEGLSALSAALKQDDAPYGRDVFGHELDFWGNRYDE
ncbi:hypothetical protein SAMN05216603_103132 [Pseudomonas benzenivorans]|nr:hypothetical protein SAMN05216603_103132 [Pseudomonas benzenivorans]